MNFDTSEGNQLSYFQNGLFLKILLSLHEPHNQVKYRLKNKVFSELFPNTFFEITFVTFVSNKSLALLILMIVVLNEQYFAQRSFFYCLRSLLYALGKALIKR